MEDLVLILTLIIAIGCAIRRIVFTWVLPFILKVCNFFNVVWAAILHGANFLLSISHWLFLAGVAVLLIKKAYDWLTHELRSLKAAIQELKTENWNSQS
jgi:hypothetical protein